MPRYRFYNRRFASRAPEINTTFGDCLPRAVGKPAVARLLGTPLGRDVSVFLPRRALNHLAVIQPPTAFVLGRHAAGFGSTGHHVFVPEHFGGGERHRFFGGWRLGLIEPSDTSHRRQGGTQSARMPIV